MPSTLFFPLDRIQPSQILSQYSEWIYFTLILVFFISISGITLRRHFDKPYVKPLIVAVGLMLTVGVFRFKGQLTKVFEGWGILGTILVVFIAATIPYGLCRGFGLARGKAFYLTYILFYIISWVQFSHVYHALGDKNLGLLNLGLLILFIISLFKMMKFRKSLSTMATDFKNTGPFRSEIDHEIEEEGREIRALKRTGERVTKIEIHTVEDMAESLAEIQRIVESHRNNLPREERLRIARILQEISSKEKILNSCFDSVRKLFGQLGTADSNQLKELKGRMAKTNGKELKILKAEIKDEEEKLRIEKMILELEQKLGQHVNIFNERLDLSLQQIRNSSYPYNAKPYLVKTRLILKDISEILKETKMLEGKIIKLTKLEKRLLKKERENV